MGKGAKTLGQNSATGQKNANTLFSEGQSIGGPLTSQLQAQAANPQGYTPQQLAYMNTASQQSLGGGAAATTGQANLEAARTRNAGGFTGAVGSANRATQRQASQNALGIQSEQAKLQQEQRQQALSALQQLYGTDTTGSNTSLQTSTTAADDLAKIQEQELAMGVSAAENVAGIG